jgi:ankyrin repeat protein
MFQYGAPVVAPVLGRQTQEAKGSNPSFLASQFTGHAFSFAREFRAAFSDPTRADWNGLLAWAIALPEHDEGATSSIDMCNKFVREEKGRVFATLVELFVSTGSDFAKELIDDSFKAEGERLFKPDPRFGGRAGGRKFRQHSDATQVFKFAEDVQEANGTWIYGGSARDDRLGMKSASHELKSAQALADAAISELFFPLMAVFTYRDKRVLCSSLLPVDETTLVQGVQSGKSLLLPSDDVATVMAMMGKRLNIGKSHLGIFGPFDLEVHRGHDGKLYIIDAARLFPPEYLENGPSQGWMYQLLRPELLQQYKGAPLVPDAMLPHDMGDKEVVVGHIRTVTENMYVAMAQLADDVNRGAVMVELVKALLHSRGVNMRHVEKVAALVDNEEVVKQLLFKRRIDPLQMQVKTLRPPRQQTEAEVRRVLASQEEELKSGKAKMQLVPTLLQLGAIVGNAIPIKTKPMRFLNLLQPEGHHPYVKAWEICQQCDPDFVRERSSPGIRSASEWSVVTMHKLLQHVETHNPKERIDFPQRGNIEQLAAKFPFLQLRESRTGTEFGAMLQRVLKEKEWDKFKEYCVLYEAFLFGAMECARVGCMELLLWSIALGKIGGECAASLFSCACDGGAVDVMSFLANDYVIDMIEGLFNASKKARMAALDFLFRYKKNHFSQAVCNRALVFAVNGGHLEATKYLVEIAGAQAKHCESVHGVQMPITFLAIRKDINVARYLLMQGACSSGGGVLIAAVLMSLDAVKMLLEEFNADANERDAGGGTALHVACQHGLLEMVKLLIESGAEVDVRKSQNSKTPAFFACQEGHYEVLMYLIAKGADIRAVACNGASLMSISCEQGRVDIASYLIEQGLDVNCKRHDGVTPLHLACETGHLSVVKLLLQSKGNVNAVTHDGRTPFWMACNQRHQAVAECLLESGLVFPMFQSKEASQALFFAALDGNLNMIKFLIDNGALLDENASNHKGESALSGACYDGNLSVVQYLVELGANVNGKRQDGASCLMSACAGCQVRVVKYLLGHGVHVNDCSLTRNTALHHACLSGSLEIVQCLVDAGADMTAPRIDGVTPLAVAKEKFPGTYVWLTEQRKKIAAAFGPETSEELCARVRLQKDVLF